MPTYEYQCKACDTRFDVFQSIKASPLRKTMCEACGGVRPVRRLIGTGGGILFKGPGFYQTDYRSEGYKKAAKTERDAGGGGSKSEKGGKDTGSSGSPSSGGDKSSGGGKTESPSAE